MLAHLKMYGKLKRAKNPTTRMCNSISSMHSSLSQKLGSLLLLLGLKIFWAKKCASGPPREYPKVTKVCQNVLYQWGPTIQGVLRCFEHSRGVKTCSRAFLPVRVYFRQNGLFWGPRGYPNGPRVGQHDV